MSDLPLVVVFCGWSHFLPSTGPLVAHLRIIKRYRIGQQLKIFERFVVAMWPFYAILLAEPCRPVPTGASLRVLGAAAQGPHVELSFRRL